MERELTDRGSNLRFNGLIPSVLPDWMRSTCCLESCTLDLTTPTLPLNSVPLVKSLRITRLPTGNAFEFELGLESTEDILLLWVFVIEY